MVRVAADPRILAHALPFHGPARTLLTLFGFGKLRAMLDEPDEALMVAVSGSGAQIHLPRPLDSHAAAELLERHPWAPDNLGLVASRELLDVVERRVAEGCRTDPELLHKAAELRLEPLAIDLAQLPQKSGDPAEIALLTAVHGGCELLVEHGGHSGARRTTVGERELVIASLSDVFAECMPERFDPDAIPPEVLVEICALLQPPGSPRAPLRE